MSLKYSAITVVIPTINRKIDLINTINYLSKQKKVKFEIIVIDQSDVPSFSKLEFSTLPCAIEYYVSSEKNASYSRNFGLIKSKFKVVLFIDDDVIINNDYLLYNYLLNYNDPSVQGVFGQVLNPGQKPTGNRRKESYNNKFGWMFFPSHYNARTQLFGIGRSCNLSVLKENAISVGGMDENYIKGAYREESDFTMRFCSAGYNIVFDPLCSLVHIGNEVGGIRSWNKNNVLKPYHHCVSEFYFLLKFHKKIGLVPSIYSSLRRQIINGVVFRNPKYLLPSCFQFIKSYIDAVKLLKQGSKYLSIEENHRRYDEIVRK